MNQNKGGKRLSRQEFRDRIIDIKKKLPPHYGVLYKSLHPNTDIRKVYNVVNYFIQDEDIMDRLDKLVTSIEENNKG